MGEKLYGVRARTLDGYGAIVCGGGFAGVAAAVSAARNGARTLLVETGGELGGDITKGIVPQLLDPAGKGGMLRDIYAFLNAGRHTSARRGDRFDESGNKLPGTVVDLEYVKYYLERACKEAGVDVLYHSTLAAAEADGGHIRSALIVTEAGNYSVAATVFVDATGNGSLAALCGCEYEIGHPVTGEPQPAGMSMLVTDIEIGDMKTDTGVDKAALKERVAASGIETSAEGIALIPCAVENCWLLSFNNQYKVDPDDIFSLSQATRDGRMECVEVFDRLKAKVAGFERAEIVSSSSHIGIREGRRIRGRYRLTLGDITGGRRFDDAVCLVRFGIDVHSISPTDRENHSKGRRVQPYNIPFRSLLPLGADNLLLAGRCISGDFYAHSSYRVIGDVIPTGEAAGYAAALCASEGALPAELDGKRVTEYMRSLGYEL